jgi:hypothetical protein
VITRDHSTFSLRVSAANQLDRLVVSKQKSAAEITVCTAEKEYILHFQIII